MTAALLFCVDTLGAVVAQAVQARLGELDIAPDGERHVDHVDVAEDEVRLETVGREVDFLVPLSVFVVTRAAALAATDTLPAGAQIAAAVCDLPVRLSLDDDARLTLQALRPACTPVLTAGWSEALARGVGHWSMDLRPLLANRNLARTSGGHVRRDGGTLAVCFGPDDAPLPRLPPGHGWGWQGTPASDLAAPPPAFAGATFAGTATGGPLLRDTPPPRRLTTASARPFGAPIRTTTCRAMERAAGRQTPPAVTLDELSSRASVRLADAGRLLDVEVVDAPFDLAPHLRRLSGHEGLSLVLPSSLTLAMRARVRLLLRTSRGLRAVDLGCPQAPELDAGGRVTDAVTEHVTNCGRADGAHGLHWRFAATRPGLAAVPPRAPAPAPAPAPDWSAWLAGLDALDVQLVLFDGLEPGELVHFQSRDHAAHVTADRHGRARVPVVMPVAGAGTEGSLVRTNRRPIAGRYVVRGVTFLDTSPHRHRGVAWLNPQPLPPVAGAGAARHPLLAFGVSLPGLVSLDAVPGFDDAPIALARMDDGTVLVVEADAPGSVRVAGSFEGPIGPLDASRYRILRA